MKKSPWKMIKGGIAAPKGFYAGAVQAGIKHKNKYDIALIYSEVPTVSAGVFTRNLVKAHPLVLSEKNLLNSKAQAVIVNSGNANACMGQIGDKAAQEMVSITAQELGIPFEDVIVSSTGVIGQELPLDKVIPGVKETVRLTKELIAEHNESMKDEYAHNAALAIMTTDTTVKSLAMEMELSGGTVKLGIMAKGSGMIHPNMGTMLCFITTDARIQAERLKEILKQAVDESFNMITVDGDTSTNDMAVVMANGLSNIQLSEEEIVMFSEMVKEACCEMAKEIARDGEGASKFIEVQVRGASKIEDARKIARSVCSSSLVKSAIYGEDANWGRILAAAGYSGAYFNPNQADIYLNGLQVALQGQGLKFSEEEAAKLLNYKEIVIKIILRDGDCAATGWGCDLTHKYVDINANYRT